MVITHLFVRERDWENWNVAIWLLVIREKIMYMQGPYRSWKLWKVMDFFFLFFFFYHFPGLGSHEEVSTSKEVVESHGISKKKKKKKRKKKKEKKKKIKTVKIVVLLNMVEIVL